MRTWTLSGRIIHPSGAVAPGSVVIEDRRIVDVAASLPPGLPDIATDGLIAPGFIDLQINGAFGYDFTVDPASVAPVAAGLPQHGVTAFLPTIITSPLETYPERLTALMAAATPGGGAEVLGVHVEGPFLNPNKKGAHNPAHLRLPSPQAVAPLVATGAMRLMTLAPELPGGSETIAYLRQHGIVVSIGHTDAHYDAARDALDQGVTWATHLFNAMPTLGHRDPGAPGALLEADMPVVGFIADGIHVHPAVARLVWRSKGAAGISLVTDAMAALGMPPGVYHIGDQQVHVTHIAARLASGTLAGSILSMDQAIRNMVAYTGCSVGDAVRMASATPADVLGLRHKGRLEAGADADIVVLDANLHVQQTFIGGESVYTAKTPAHRAD